MLEPSPGPTLEIAEAAAENDVKKSKLMTSDEDVFKEASKWFNKRWKITVAGEKTNKRLVNIEQLVNYQWEILEKKWYFDTDDY